MKYYKIECSVDLGVIGRHPQVGDAIFKTRYDSPHLLGMVHLGKDIREYIEIPEFILHSKSKQTDLLSQIYLGYMQLISQQLKELIEAKQYDGIQFFKTILHGKNNEKSGYWIINPFGFRNSYIDFPKSEIICQDMPNMTQVMVKDENELLHLQNDEKKILKFYWIENPVLKKELIKEDFFLLNGMRGVVGYVVSENFKNEIIKAGCTGIKFTELKSV